MIDTEVGLWVNDQLRRNNVFGCFGECQGVVIRCLIVCHKGGAFGLFAEPEGAKSKFFRQSQGEQWWVLGEP